MARQQTGAGTPPAPGAGKASDSPLHLELAQAKQDDIALQQTRAPSSISGAHGSAAERGASAGAEQPAHHSNPHALAQLPSYVAQSVHAVKAKGLQPPISQHPRHLCVLCAEQGATRALQKQSLGPPGAAAVQTLLCAARGGALAPCPSSLKVSSRLASESFFPLRRFLPPLPCAGQDGSSALAVRRSGGLELAHP